MEQLTSYTIFVDPPTKRNYFFLVAKPHIWCVEKDEPIIAIEKVILG